MTTRNIVFIVIAVMILIFAIRTCQTTKKVEIKQKSSDDSTSLSVKIKKEKPEENNNQ